MVKDEQENMIYILTQKSNTECKECMSQDVEIVAVRSSLKKGLEAIKKYENEESHWCSFELTGYEVDTDRVKSKMIASLDRRVDMSSVNVMDYQSGSIGELIWLGGLKKAGLVWKLWIAEEYKENWCDGERKRSNDDSI
jgi:hypothetical protein